METTKSLATGLLLAGVFMSFMSPSAASDFIVGGRAGWVQSPVVPYNNWAGAMRFHVNDSLVFKYKKGDDSVLVVDKSGYESCNATGPLVKLDGGDSVYKLARTGPNYFISGEAGHCGNGQKLVVVVMAVRNKPSLPPPFIATPPSMPPSITTPPSMPPSIATPPALPPSITTPPAMPPSIATPPSVAVPPFFAATPSLSPSAETPTMVSPIMAPLLSPNSPSEEPMPLGSAPSPADKGSSPYPSPSAEVPMMVSPTPALPPADKGSSPSPYPSAEDPMMVSPTPALPPADKGSSSSSVLSASGVGVTLGMATMLLSGVLFG